MGARYDGIGRQEVRDQIDTIVFSIAFRGNPAYDALDSAQGQETVKRIEALREEYAAMNPNQVNLEATRRGYPSQASNNILSDGRDALDTYNQLTIVPSIARGADAGSYRVVTGSLAQADDSLGADGLVFTQRPGSDTMDVAWSEDQGTTQVSRHASLDRNATQALHQLFDAALEGGINAEERAVLKDVATQIAGLRDGDFSAQDNQAILNMANAKREELETGRG